MLWIPHLIECAFRCGVYFLRPSLDFRAEITDNMGDFHREGERICCFYIPQ